MARQLIQILRLENIEFVVAPYEADAQLAYLSGLEAEDGGVVAVISEDSDLLVYGCSAVVFKMDRYGNGEERELDNVFNTVGCVQSFNGVSISKKKKSLQDPSKTNITTKINLMKLEVNGVNSSTPM
ncbi:exonuclease 1-like isoform X4 [Henckelia pumila]